MYLKLWKPYTCLCIRDDGATWVLSREAAELNRMVAKLNIPVVSPMLFGLLRRQAVFYPDQYSLLDESNYLRKHRYGVAMFHGRPGQGEVFDRMYNQLNKWRDRVHRVQLSHHALCTFVEQAGVDKRRIHVIPIGVNLSNFEMVSDVSKLFYRKFYGIPISAFVVGSFQKDGNGWGEGLEPKLIKGPDVFIETIRLLKQKISELFVLLCGPARGYVKTGLERIGVPYLHRYVKNYTDIGEMYQALDLYIVSSREEGGPKAILESMASGVPLVTTKVGQANDLIKHEQNGWIVQPEDPEALAFWAEKALHNRSELDYVLGFARQTAEANSYEAQIPLWSEFMKGFVER